MKLIPACMQVRLDSFHAKKTRRSSTRSSTSRTKKAPKSNKADAWPLIAPSPNDLAFAGFLWAPSTSSPDNVKCFVCDCQLDGWEESDVPAFEHLTHSPNCGYAINACIRLRIGDPARVEEDPLSDKMQSARQATFGNYWPLDPDAGFPSVEQMVTAGWFYDPAPDTPDAVTCAYCTLSLDSWDAGDDPAQEHLKRAPDCLFFSLKDLYHPPAPPAPAQPKKTRKRASSRAKSTTTATTKRAPATAPAPRPAPTRIEAPQKHKSITPEPSKSVTPEPSKSITPEPSKSEDIIEYPELIEDTNPAKSTPEPLKKRKSENIIIAKSTPKPSKKRKSDVPDKSTPEPSKKRKSEANIENTEAFIPPVKKAKLFGEDHTLTKAELDMTVEQWVLYNAEQAAQYLRDELEEQVSDFDKQGKLALDAIDAISVY